MPVVAENMGRVRPGGACSPVAPDDGATGRKARFDATGSVYDPVPRSRSGSGWKSAHGI